MPLAVGRVLVRQSESHRAEVAGAVRAQSEGMERVALVVLVVPRWVRVRLRQTPALVAVVEEASPLAVAPPMVVAVLGLVVSPLVQ